MKRPVHPKSSIENAPGMTLREHYAGLAMQGLVTGHMNCGPGSHVNMAAFFAHFAVEYADALLAALAEKPEAGK